MNESFLAIIILICIIPLIVFSVNMLKKLMIKIPKAHQEIQVISQRQLGSREKVVVIEIYQEQFLLGVTSENINILHSFGPRNLKSHETTLSNDWPIIRGHKNP